MKLPEALQRLDPQAPLPLYLQLKETLWSLGPTPITASLLGSWSTIYWERGRMITYASQILVLTECGVLLGVPTFGLGRHLLCGGGPRIF